MSQSYFTISLIQAIHLIPNFCFSIGKWKFFVNVKFLSFEITLNISNIFNNNSWFSIITPEVAIYQYPKDATYAYYFQASWLLYVYRYSFWRINVDNDIYPYFLKGTYDVDKEDIQIIKNLLNQLEEMSNEDSDDYEDD